MKVLTPHFSSKMSDLAHCAMTLFGARSSPFQSSLVLFLPPSRAEKSSKSWLSTSVSGEGILQTFSGTGKVWLAPTQGVYEKLATEDGMMILSQSPGSLGTKVNDKK